MRNNGVLKAVVILQAVCMIALAVVVAVKLWPVGGRSAEGSDTESPDEGLDKAVATVGGEPITEAEFRRALDEKYGDEVLRTMMVRKAIDLEARNLGLQVTDEEQTAELAAVTSGYASEEDYFRVMQEQLGMTRDEVLEDMKYRLLLEKIATRDVTVSEQEISEYVSKNRDSFGDRLQLHLRWIVTATEREADDIVDRLAAGEDFEQLAAEASIDAFTAGDGGDLGFIDANDPFYSKEIMDTASRMQTGEIAGPFEVDAGFAVIQLVERQLTEGLSDEEIREKAVKQLALAKAESLHGVEEELLKKYGAVIIP
ncbi:peptidylprolyl isomerase [Paenibacillus thailandensis]|uniref:peptidylprolyl isomerase n=1 Tax=Paenibacillus thailandensis TaxID=393250 RepID=A0ABW5R1B3_9BACL